MNAKQYSEAAGQPQPNDDDDDEQDLRGIIAERRQAKKENAHAQTGQGKAEQTVQDVTQAGGYLATLGTSVAAGLALGGPIGAAVGAGKVILGILTKGKVGYAIGHALASIPPSPLERELVAGDPELGRILYGNDTEEEKQRKRHLTAQATANLIGFKKGGRVNKSGKALVHKKEFIVKSGVKVTKSQKMKVQKRKESKKETKKMIQKAPKK